MLFNSYEFIFFFLPLALAGFFVLGKRLGREAAIGWLVLASLFYYAWWNPRYLLLILASMVFNYACGRGITAATGRPGKRALLVLGVSANIAALAYYKYANFFAENLASFGVAVSLDQIVLPLAISFFTFQQIAYLADAYAGLAREYRFVHYSLFVCFFPQLIAGPIVHHKEMMPQFMQRDVWRPQAVNLAVGLSIFALGLCKKVILADGVAVYASPVFDAAAAGEQLDFFRAWGGALAYTLQLYFDFSGYSDMAIGAARMFGIKLPLNFFSPYKATSIVEFWRRWHMTLSRFLRDYLYIPLGGNRHGNARRYSNLMITMLLGGLWHGAGWTFVLWGGLHGLYLIVNHAWHWVLRLLGSPPFTTTAWYKGCAWALTLLAVIVGWVFFRAADYAAAANMLHAMSGGNGLALPNAIVSRLGLGAGLQRLGIDVYLGGGGVFVSTWAWIAATMAVALIAPNTHQMLRDYEPAVSDYRHDPRYAVQPLRAWVQQVRWQPRLAWSLAIGAVLAASVLGLTRISEFLYFQF